MGKLVTFISILIFIDLIFLITGQLAIDSPSSVILSAIVNPSDIRTSNFWAVLIAGLSALSIVSAIVAGLVTRSSDLAIFFGMAGTLALLIGDYITIFDYLYSINDVFATVILMPIILMFTLIIIEWARSKD